SITKLFLFPSKNSSSDIISKIKIDLSIRKPRKNGSWKIIRYSPQNSTEGQSLLLAFNGPGYSDVGALLLVPKLQSIQVFFKSNPNPTSLAKPDKICIHFLFDNFITFMRAKYSTLFSDICFHNLFNSNSSDDIRACNSSNPVTLSALFEFPALQKDFPREIIDHIFCLKHDPLKIHSLWKIEQQNFPDDDPDLHFLPYAISLNNPDFKGIGCLRIRNGFDRISVVHITPYSYQRKLRRQAPFLLTLFAHFLETTFPDHLSSFQISFL
ncbi:MAG: hypothetical protein J1F67_11955, partial [Muribaculaceae bacterium]|nr:hypothetical protein [Muribaculaceae bacterium]